MEKYRKEKIPLFEQHTIRDKYRQYVRQHTNQPLFVLRKTEEFYNSPEMYGHFSAKIDEIISEGPYYGEGSYYYGPFLREYVQELLGIHNAMKELFEVIELSYNSVPFDGIPYYTSDMMLLYGQKECAYQSHFVFIRKENRGYGPFASIIDLSKWVVDATINSHSVTEAELLDTQVILANFFIDTFCELFNFVQNYSGSIERKVDSQEEKSSDLEEEIIAQNSPIKKKVRADENGKPK